MEESRKTLAIVLNRQDYREYDSLVSFYTSEFGKITLLARGTKRLKSKLAGHLEPMNLIDLMIIPGKGRDYAAGAINQEVFFSVKEDLNKLYYAGLGLRWFRNLTPENEQDKPLFFLLLEYLKTLNNIKQELIREDGELLFSFFAFKFLTEMGYKPELEHCLNCHKKICPGKNYFNLHSGGLMCESCFAAEKNREIREILTISDNCVKILRFMLENSLGLSLKIKIDKKLVKELATLTKGFLNFRN
jgi:DNA repair protein RecO (recombination protein O)